MKLSIIGIMLVSISVFSQTQPTDSLRTQLSEVVITGQFESQSLKKSIHNVRVITKEDIKM